jgi:hypothetical protein
MTQVFISYSRKDLAFVEHLVEDLKAAGLEAWYDLSGLDGGTRWGREIQSAIEASQCFVVVLSPNSVESEWVEKEFMYANSLKKRIIPLLYQPCKTPMWFINLHFIDVQGDNYDRNFWVILKAMGVRAGDEAAKRTPVAAALSPLPIQRKARLHPAWIIALVGVIAMLAFAVWGMPALAARLAPMPTPTPTSTPTTAYTPIPTDTPISTPTITPSPTSTVIASPTPTPTTGSVTGSIMWADKPFGDVQVMLCSDWLYTCNGEKFTGVTQSDGSFSMGGVTPGEYYLITKYPGQNDETRYVGPRDDHPPTFSVSAGVTVDAGPISICKKDLFVYAPASANGARYMKFSWKPYPGATDYHLQLVGYDAWDTKGINSYKDLQPGSYQVIVSVIGPACTQGIINFTVP